MKDQAIECYSDGENTLLIEYDWYPTNPRTDDWNLDSPITMLTWEDGYYSIDDNSQYPHPESLVSELISEHISPEVFLTNIQNGILKGYSITDSETYLKQNPDASDSDGFNYEEYPQIILAYNGNPEVVWDWDVIEGEDGSPLPPSMDDMLENIEIAWDEIAENVAEHPQALKMFEGSDVYSRLIYTFEHGIKTYSLNGFNDFWDSGACGIAYTTKNDMERFIGRSLDEDEWRGFADKQMDAEMSEYAKYSEGQVYMLSYFEGTELEDSVSNVYLDDRIDRSSKDKFMEIADDCFGLPSDFIKNAKMYDPSELCSYSFTIDEFLEGVKEQQNSEKAKPVERSFENKRALSASEVLSTARDAAEVTAMTNLSNPEEHHRNIQSTQER